jgi:hypothetical protein
MLTIFPLFVLSILALCALAAAWPLLAERRLRPSLVGITGTGCIAGGASLMAVLMSGLLPGITPTAAAQDDATTKSETVAPSSTEGSGAPTPDSRPPTPSPSDPVLEVPPTTEVVIPPGRPSWVEQDPQTNSSGIHTIPVSSYPYKRHIDAVNALNEQLEKELGRYIADHVGSELAPTFIRYEADAIRRELIKSENIYEEKIVSPTTGDMYQIHALVEIDQSFREGLDHQWQRFRATSRLTQLGLFAGAGLLLIGSIFSYFRLDNATRGYYTGRLQFLTAAAILAVIGGGAFVAQWIHWL